MTLPLALPTAPPATASTALPRGPVLDWPALAGARAAGVPAVDDAPHQLLCTSGRAALFLGLRALGVGAGSRVLVPTYHCPTMIAPVVLAGAEPVFFPIDENGLPALAAIDAGSLQGAKAMIVAHYFGRARSLALVRRWCDEHGIALIEDCAHSFFGPAGERAVGAWGDVAIASLTKFFPLPEAGLLVSDQRALPRLETRPGALTEIKGGLDVLEQAARSGRLRGARPLLQALFALKRLRAAPAADSSTSAGPISADPLQGNDMSRAERLPLAVAKAMFKLLPRERMVQRRRAHHEHLFAALSGLAGARPLPGGSAQDVPYALPLWVDDAQRVYDGLRQHGLPVARWDHCWRGTPALPGDEGARWRHHVIQLLCHQDLSERELDGMAAAVTNLLNAR